MMWKVELLASHSATAACSRDKITLSASLDMNVSTSSSSKGNWIDLENSINILNVRSKLYLYPTPRHFEQIAQLPVFDDLRRVAEVNVRAADVGSQVQHLADDFPTLHVVASQLVVNPHHPSLFDNWLWINNTVDVLVWPLVVLYLDIWLGFPWGLR